MKRRVSIVRNTGTGDVLVDKALTIKLDGLNQGNLETGCRLVFDANDKAHTMTVSHKGEWNLELNHPIPAGEGDTILVLNCEKNNYTISDAQYRRLTVRRENGNTTLGLWAKVDGKEHPRAWILDNVGDWITVCVDTGVHSLKLQAHGLFGSKDIREVTVPAGTRDEEYIATVNDDKTVTVKRKIQAVSNPSEQKPVKNKSTMPNHNVLPGGLSDEKMLNYLNNQLKESGGKLFEKLLEQNKSGPTLLRVEVGSKAVSFNLKMEDGFRTAATLYYEHLADTSIPGVAEQGITLNTQEERNAVLRFIHDFVYSNKNVHFALHMGDNGIYLEEEYAEKLRLNLLEKTEDIYSSSTTYHLKMELKALLNPEHGEVYQWLSDADTVRVGFGAVDDCMVVSADIMVDGKVKSPAKVKELYYQDVNRDTDELRQMAKLTGGTFPDSVNQFDFLETYEKEELLNEVLQQFINSDQCPGVYYEDHEIKLEPGFGIDIADSATTSFLRGDYLKSLFSNRGILCDALMNPNEAAEYIDVAVGFKGISFNGHYPGMKKGEVKTLYTILLEDVNTETVLTVAEQMKGIRGMGPVYHSLETQQQRDDVLDIIRDFINEELVYAQMKGSRITAAPEANDRPAHPDMNYSLTSALLWHAMLRQFGEDSDFAKITKKTPAASFVTAEADRLRVNIMYEDEAGTTEVFEVPYTDCTANELPETYDALKLRDWQNRFERLDDPADQKELVDFLMWMMDVFPHIIIEGNSFRSRRPNEEIIEVGQTLTGQMMARKVVKLFDLDGEFIDILRHSNIDFCHIAGYKDYLAFIFNDKNGKVVKTIYRDFSELVDEDFLSGEDCFDHLTCGYEKDELSYFLGKAVGKLPYMRTRSEEHLDSNILFINQDMVPMLSESYLADPAKSDEPTDADIPAVSETLAEPAWTVETSATTQAVIADLMKQFGLGGGMTQFMKDMGLEKAELMTGSSEIVIGLWKGSSCTSRISLQYAQYGSGEEGAYQVLNEEDQKVLQECILTAVPYFNV